MCARAGVTWPLPSQLIFRSLAADWTSAKYPHKSTPRTWVDYHPGVRVLAIAVLLSAIGSVGGLAVGSLILVVRDSLRRKLVPWLVAYAVGTLLGVALLALVPEALERLRAEAVLGTLLGGILGFFLLEKLVLWQHQHADEPALGDGSATLILIGGALHNFADGAVIGAATLTSTPLGVTAAIAVAAHQIPQEIGDFAILLGAGFTPARALTLNVLSGLTGILGAVAMFFAWEAMPHALPYVLAFAAGNFLYVAMADLIPGLHRTPGTPALPQALIVGAGVATILAL